MATLKVKSSDGRVFTPPTFSHKYKLSTVQESNDRGNWFGWNIEILFDAKTGGILEKLPNGQDIYLAARKFKSKVTSGEVNVSPDEQDDVM